MREEELLRRAFAMPLTNPAYPPGPYRFVNREYLIITYRTDPAKLGRECQRCAPQVGDAFIPGMKRGL